MLLHDRLLVKIGGDHGGGSLKLSFQLGNVAQLNSIKNTVPFLVAAAMDSASNVATSLQPYSRQIASLQELTSENKSTQVTFFCDYGLQCQVYGISGASGIHPCLFCHMTKKAMQLSPLKQPDATVWSLDTLEYAYNVIQPTMLPVPLEDVCIPSLNLDLGIFPWIFQALCADARTLNAHLAQELSSADTTNHDGKAFCVAVSLNEALVKKKIEADTAEQDANLARQQVQFCVTFHGGNNFTSIV